MEKSFASADSGRIPGKRLQNRVPSSMSDAFRVRATAFQAPVQRFEKRGARRKESKKGEFGTFTPEIALPRRRGEEAL
jgi:hypothetical protein